MINCDGKLGGESIAFYTGPIEEVRHSKTSEILLVGGMSGALLLIQTRAGQQSASQPASQPINQPTNQLISNPQTTTYTPTNQQTNQPTDKLTNARLVNCDGKLRGESIAFYTGPNLRGGETVKLARFCLWTVCRALYYSFKQEL